MNLTKDICIKLKKKGFPQESPVRYDTEDGPVCCPSLEELIEKLFLSLDGCLAFFHEKEKGWQCRTQVGCDSFGEFGKTLSEAVVNLYISICSSSQNNETHQKDN